MDKVMTTENGSNTPTNQTTETTLTPIETTLTVIEVDLKPKVMMRKTKTQIPQLVAAMATKVSRP